MFFFYLVGIVFSIVFPAQRRIIESMIQMNYNFSKFMDKAGLILTITTDYLIIELYIMFDEHNNYSYKFHSPQHERQKNLKFVVTQINFTQTSFIFFSVLLPSFFVSV